MDLQPRRFPSNLDSLFLGLGKYTPRRFAFKFGFTGEIYSFDASMENRELKNIRFEGQRRLGQVSGRAGDGLQIR